VAFQNSASIASTFRNFFYLHAQDLSVIEDKRPRAEDDAQPRARVCGMRRQQLLRRTIRPQIDKFTRSAVLGIIFPDEHSHAQPSFRLTSEIAEAACLLSTDRADSLARSPSFANWRAYPYDTHSDRSSRPRRSCRILPTGASFSLSVGTAGGRTAGVDSGLG
jgi:hypothetical protein